ncbi:heme-binding protein [Caenimonas sp. DR4.4]|uniref:Heme-binding protein n=2 Tax=Caenimonas aquaedulcis TaxID=2793270 RepID=A0A931H8X7_9BURK|nr:heme-binding protein [Caenimonas aquaedulcis]
MAQAGSAAPPRAEFAPALSLDQATRLMQGAFAYARERGAAVTIAVVDAGGHLVAAGRMDGMPFGTFDVARGKAIASVATGGESGKALMERYRMNPIVFGQISALSYGGPMFPSQGSLPIFIDGRLAGAAGGSGASSQFDEDAVRAGIRSIGAQAERP